MSALICDTVPLTWERRGGQVERMRGQLALKQNGFIDVIRKKTRLKRFHYHYYYGSDCSTTPTCRHKRASLGRTRGRRSRAIRGSYSPSCETTIQGPKERGRGKECSLNRIMHVRSLGLIGHATLMIPRGRKEKGKSHASRVRSRAQGVVETDRQALGCALFACGVEQRKSYD